MRRSKVHSCPSVERDGGFSLIEMIVSLTLLALILSAMPNGLRLAGRAWNEALELDQSAADAATMSMIEQKLGGAMSIFQRAGGAMHIAFTGSENSLTFVAPAEHGPNGGGLYRFQLAVEDVSGQGRVLLLRCKPLQIFSSEPDNPAWTDERILVSGLSEASIRYLASSTTGTPSDVASQWSTQWTNTATLPALVEIKVTTSRKSGHATHLATTEMHLR